MANFKSKARTWHKGPPPHVGWWNADYPGWRCEQQWRWWNGELWSSGVHERMPPDLLEELRPEYVSTIERMMLADTVGGGAIEWTDYWPENARVPRGIESQQLRPFA